MVTSALNCINSPSIAIHLTTFSPKCCCLVLAVLFLVSDAWHSYRDLKGQFLAAIVGRKGVENGRELLGIELDYNRLSASVFGMPSAMHRARRYSRSWKSFSQPTTTKGNRAPSTTAPITEWILPSLAASVDANLAARAGAKDFLMGWKVRWTVAGRREAAREARSDRWKPLSSN